MRFLASHVCGLLALWGACGSLAAVPPTVLFHPDGRPVDNYDAIVASLTQDQVIQFGNGKRFKIRTVLGSGKSSKVLAVDRSRAIKIPLRADRAMDALNDFLQGFQEIRDYGVPVVAIYPRASLPGQYISIEELRPHPAVGRLISLSEFAQGYFDRNTPAYLFMATELLQFAGKSFRISRFGDQGARQVLFTDVGWKLVDFSRDHRLAIKPLDSIPFTSVYAERPGRSCSSAMMALMYEMYDMAQQSMLSVPEELEIPIKLEILRKRMSYFNNLDFSQYGDWNNSPLWRPM